MKIKPSHLFLILVSLAASCADPDKTAPDDRKYEIVEVRFSGSDTCFGIEKNSARLEFSREIEIIKNRLSDTILFGTGLLVPGYTGNFAYYGVGSRTDVSYYEDPEGLADIRTDTLCLRATRYSPRGTLTLKLYY